MKARFKHLRFHNLTLTIGAFFMRSICKTFLISLLIFTSVHVQAEQCWQISGCDNLIGWIRIDKFSYEAVGKNIYKNGSESIFGSESLPNVNSIVKTQRLTKIRQIDWGDSKSTDCHDYDYKKGEIAEACDSDSITFDYLGESAVVRVLGYHKRKHLYVLVQVISYPQDPFKLEKEKRKNLTDQDI